VAAEHEESRNRKNREGRIKKAELRKKFRIG
jgi:hypothetical protein